MESKIRALKFQVEQVGKHIKSTKKRYFWSLSIGQRYFNFVMDDSLVSGKSKLSINGKVFHQTEQSGLQRSPYDHSFIIEGCLFNITEHQSGFEMRVNNKMFSHMLTRELGANCFEDHKVDESCFELAGKIKQNQNKKITLNLPGMTSGMKKKKCAAQSENWNDFTGANSFPNYFGQEVKKQAPIKIIESPTVVPEKIQEVQCSKQQFSTLQNLFKTITASGQYVQKPICEGVAPTYEIAEIPSIPQINLQQFNTMQNLFSTINASQPKTQITKPNAQNQSVNDIFSTLQIGQKVKNTAEQKQQDLSVIHKSFNTMKGQPKQCSFTTSVPQNLNQVNLNDFNTLQNLFSTGLNIPNQVPLSQTNKKNQQQQFFTIKNSFDSNFQTNSVPPQKLINLSKINVNDFNTMQNLFATNSHKDALTITDKANKFEQPAKVQSIPNQLDFNTMQNLFATKGGKPQTNQNNFWQFQ